MKTAVTIEYQGGRVETATIEETHPLRHMADLDVCLRLAMAPECKPRVSQIIIKPIYQPKEKHD